MYRRVLHCRKEAGESSAVQKSFCPDLDLFFGKVCLIQVLPVSALCFRKLAHSENPRHLHVGFLCTAAVLDDALGVFDPFCRRLPFAALFDAFLSLRHLQIRR